MIPEKVCQAQSAPRHSSPSADRGRTHTLSVSENGRMVGKFVYDRLSSAVSLVHELAVLAKIKFTQLEIVDGNGGSFSEYSFAEQQSSVPPNEKSIQGGLEFDQIGKFLAQHLEQCRSAQMPCSVVLLSALLPSQTAVNHDSALIELISMVGKSKGPHDQLFWYPQEGASPNHAGTQAGQKPLLGTGFCFILPASGLIKARLLVDSIKKQLREHAEFSGALTLCAGVGVRTTSDISEEQLLAKVDRLLQKSIRNDGKLMASTDISSNSQVTVEERSQLFMISKKTL